MTLNDIRKDLYKSKVNAKFTHYCAGKLYYSVVIDGSTYQFPISTTDTINKCTYTVGKVEITVDEHCTLSTDLGNTSFHVEIKASELIRWIGKAFESEELIKISI